MASSSSYDTMAPSSRAVELSYSNMSTGSSGQVIPRDKKEASRRELGYCLTCPHVPVLLYDVHRSKLNPLRLKRTPRKVAGECVDGRCLKCSSLEKPPRSSSLHSTTSFSSAHRRSFTGPQDEGKLSSSDENSDSQSQKRRRSRKKRAPRQSRSLLSKNLSDEPDGVEATDESRGNSTLQFSDDRQLTLRNSRRLSGTRSHKNENCAVPEGTTSSAISIRRHSSHTRRCRSTHGSFGMNGQPDFPSALTILDHELSNTNKYSAPDSSRTSRRHSFSQDSPSVSGGDGRQFASGSGNPPQADVYSQPSQTQPVGSRRDGNEQLIHPSPLLRQRRASIATPSAASEYLRTRNLNRPKRILRREPLARCKMEPGKCAGEDRRSGYNVPGHDANEHPIQHNSTTSDVVSVLRHVREVGCPELYVNSIVSLMEQYRDDEDVQITCCRDLLRNLNTDILIADRFVQARGHMLLFRTATTFQTSHIVGELTCKTLYKLATSEGARLPLIADGTCTFVVKTMGKELGNETLMQDALGMLRIFSTVLDARSQMMAHDISGLTADVMLCNPSDPVIQRDGCAIIANMAFDGEAVLEVGKSTVNAVLGTLMNSNRMDCETASACFALNNLSFNEGNLRVMVSSEGLFRALEEIASENSAELLQRMCLLQQKMNREQSAQPLRSC